MKIYREIALLLLILTINACIRPDKIQNEAIKTFMLSDTMKKQLVFDTVTEKKLRTEMGLFGKISADFNKLIEIFPVVGGNVVSVNVELGDKVEKGQLLATIRSIEVAGYEMELTDARTDVLVARKNLKVAQELFEGKLGTEKEVIQAQAELDKANSNLSRIEETFSIYNMKKGALFEIRSPISGFIVQKDINQDMMLRSDRSDNIFDIAQLDQVWVIANVNESDIQEVSVGMFADITTLSYPGKHFIGEVDKIFNVIDPETKAMKVRVKLNNPEFLLKPEMRAIVKLFKTNQQEMLSVNPGAVIFDNGKSYVVVYKSGNAVEIREVKIHSEVSDAVFIESGLKKGEVVVSKNQLYIYDELNS